MLSYLNIRRLVVTLGLLHAAAAQGDPHYALTLTTDTFAPDGFPKEYVHHLSPLSVIIDGHDRSIAINGQFVGPLLAVGAGQRVMVNVTSLITSTDIRQSTSVVSQSFSIPFDATLDY